MSDQIESQQQLRDEFDRGVPLSRAWIILGPPSERESRWLLLHDNDPGSILEMNDIILGLIRDIRIGIFEAIGRVERRDGVIEFRRLDKNICYEDFFDVENNSYRSPNFEMHDIVILKSKGNELNCHRPIAASEVPAVNDEGVNLLEPNSLVDVECQFLDIEKAFNNFQNSKNKTKTGYRKDFIAAIRHLIFEDRVDVSALSQGELIRSIKAELWRSKSGKFNEANEKPSDEAVRQFLARHCSIWATQ